MGFTLAKNNAAYAKVGIMGMQGAGKTYLATDISIGLQKMSLERGITTPDTPVFFLDTETGSDFMIKRYHDAGMELLVDKTRAFKNLVPAIEEVAKVRGTLIIDSITHFWKELCTSYAHKKNRHDLVFADWAFLKDAWSTFTDAFVNSQCHIVMCGRAGYEYDFFDNDAGKKELVKTGIKMKAENETGFEPSLLLLVERHQTLDHGAVTEVFRTCHVIKDRADLLDGKVFRNTTFEDLKPHFETLNLGGEQVGIDTTDTSENIIPAKEISGTAWKMEKDATLDEIKMAMLEQYPGTTAKEKAGKAALLEKFFGTKSWKRVETYSLDELKRCFSKMKTDREMTEAGGTF